MDEVEIRQKIIDSIESMVGIFDDGLEKLPTRWLFWLHHYLASGDVKSELNERMSRQLNIKLASIGIRI